MSTVPDAAIIVSLGGFEDGWAPLTIETHSGKRFVFSLGRYQLRLINVMSGCALLGLPAGGTVEGDEGEHVVGKD